MKQILLLGGLLAQFIVAFAAFIWILAFLGFTDETKRSASASPFGKIVVALCVVLGAAPMGITLWVTWHHYFPPTHSPKLPLYLPLLATIGCSLVCSGLIYLFKKAGYRNKPSDTKQ